MKRKNFLKLPTNAIVSIFGIGVGLPEDQERLGFISHTLSLKKIAY